MFPNIAKLPKSPAFKDWGDKQSPALEWEKPLNTEFNHVCLVLGGSQNNLPRMRSDVKKEKRNYYLLFLFFHLFPFIFAIFFPSRATENYFYMHQRISLTFTPWYLFIENVKRKKTFPEQNR